jgi:hypothetical protein
VVGWLDLAECVLEEAVTLDLDLVEAIEGALNIIWRARNEYVTETAA